MPKGKTKIDDGLPHEGGPDSHPSSGIERLTNILALLLVKDLNQTEAIKLLSRAGFQPKELASLLSCASNTVSVTLYRAKKGDKEKGKRAKN